MPALNFILAVDHPELLAEPVAATLARHRDAGWIDQVQVAEIDTDYAGGSEICEHYGVPIEEAGNCLIIEGRRGEQVKLAACLTPPGTRTDLNGVARKHLGARRVSLMDRDAAISQTNMEYGSITPVGLPVGWEVLIDPLLATAPRVVIGSGRLRSKLRLPGPVLLELTGGEALDGLTL
jgi:prolyl-tRNA editing enzyme YbaK/EbsC (Cys-tRNA(Pro) deacylase)